MQIENDIWPKKRFAIVTQKVKEEKRASCGEWRRDREEQSREDPRRRRDSKLKEGDKAGERAERNTDWYFLKDLKNHNLIFLSK